MAQFKSVKNDGYYRQDKLKYGSGPKPEAHFYPDVTDDVLKSGKYDIEWILSYADTEKAIKAFESVHTIQMAFANANTADTHDIYIHYLDIVNDTQRVAHVEFNMRNEPIIKEWV